ncbi:uncharacterized protein LOC117124367 isoform X2 [Anneissia japonica]|nr:uncharacterized protein LOC117124367 isoform X2 [Anneissia japonica]
MKSTQSAWVLLLICLLVTLLCQMSSCQHHTTGRDRNVNNPRLQWKSGKRTQPSTETQEAMINVRRAESARFLAKLLKEYAEKMMYDNEGDYIQTNISGDVTNDEYHSGVNPRWYEG